MKTLKTVIKIIGGILLFSLVVLTVDTGLLSDTK